MAPPSKRSSHTEGMEPETESASHNSITVAASVPAPASIAGSETGSIQSSPDVTTQSADEVAKPSIPIRAARDSMESRDNIREAESSGRGHMMPPMANRPAGRDYYHEYEFSDLDEITVRQLNEDILAYRYDLDYCKAQLEEADLTPQETRTLQLRTLDLGHQIRHCTHRIETIKAQSRKHSFHPAHGIMTTMPYAANGTSSGSRQARGGMSGGHGLGLLPARGRVAVTPSLAGGKRPMLDDVQGSVKRAKMASPDMDMMGGGGGGGGGAGGGLDEGVNTALQRLGFWKCRLCSAPKYLLAGAGRSPAAPCKWPLKDISKMITHFTEMHAEHTPAERCAELGAALAQNRGPFEYWLRRTRAQNISDGSIIDDCVDALLHGDMPELLRRHSRAAAGMPAY